MNGVYPNMKDSLFGTRRDYLETRLKEASRHCARIFPELSGSNELAAYLETIDPKARELVLEVDGFVNIMYNELTSIPEYLRDALAIILMFSIVETVQLATMKYVRLSDWLRSEECARKLDDLTEQYTDSKHRLKALTEAYFSRYGSARAALDFFEKCFPEDDKKSLIRVYRTLRMCLDSVSPNQLKALMPEFDDSETTITQIEKALRDRVKIDRAYLPVCYVPSCYIQYGKCDPDVRCRLEKEEILLESLRKVVKRLLYAYRNAFVHESRLPTLVPTLVEENEKPSTKRSYSIVYDHLYGRHIAHSLDLQFLLEAFRISLRQFFDKRRVRGCGGGELCSGNSAC